jgi:hypothetical protein
MVRSRSKSKRSSRRWRPNRSKSLPKSCFLGSDHSYPICPAGKRSPSCRGVIAAYSRAATVAGRARKHGTRGGPRARSVMRKASALRKRHGCVHVWDTFKRKSRSRRCKYGKLKHAVKTPSGGKRYCRKSHGPHRRSKRGSHKRSKKKSRSRRRKSCKFGKLKHAVKTPSGGKRYCRKSHGPHRRSKRGSHKRSKKKSRSRRRKSCKFGKLKHPVKMPNGSMRRCKKRRSQKYGGNKGDESKSRRNYGKKRSHSRRKRH